MKTKAFKYLKLVLLTFAMVNLTACEIEIDAIIISHVICVVVPG